MNLHRTVAPRMLCKYVYFHFESNDSTRSEPRIVLAQDHPRARSARFEVILISTPEKNEELVSIFMVRSKGLVQEHKLDSGDS